MGIVTMYKLVGSEGQTEYYLDHGFHVSMFYQSGWFGQDTHLWVIVRYR